ncbi:gliding motility protein GldN [Flammeovirgaceae bacterium SG7u.111]|nr:gliding motility protein GldN [Flammeovirgaceae bacterium SG7u.132]WPO36891.1 gliding motility protein GldN [Flammeovirgaceae bacterium SG7u.111]
MMIFKKFVLFLLGGLMMFAAEAQQMARNNDQPADLYNENSVRPVRKDDIMFKKTLWFRVDMRQKANAPFFATDKEITGLLIDAVKAGIITPYADDNLDKKLSEADFLERLKVPTMNDLDQMGDDDEGTWDNDDDWGDAGGEETASELAADMPVEFFPKQLYVMEIKEDYLFDRRESRAKHDVQVLTIIIPADQNPLGLDKELASFSYRELAEKLFKNNPDAIWFNPQNSAASLNLSEAFDLRLYNGMLVKYEHPKNSSIVELYGGGKRALQASQEAVYKLLEYEALLWEY